jgi:hypothetical protein
MEHHSPHESLTWAHTCIHVASTIGSGHQSPPPPSAPTTAYRSIVARACTAGPTTLSFVAYACGPYLLKLPQPRHTRPNVYVRNNSTCVVRFLSWSLPSLESEVVLNQRYHSSQPQWPQSLLMSSLPVATVSILFR